MDRGIEPASLAPECIPLGIGPRRMIGNFNTTEPAHRARDRRINVRAPQCDRRHRVS